MYTDVYRIKPPNYGHLDEKMMLNRQIFGARLTTAKGALRVNTARNPYFQPEHHRS